MDLPKNVDKKKKVEKNKSVILKKFNIPIKNFKTPKIKDLKKKAEKKKVILKKISDPIMVKKLRTSPKLSKNITLKK